MRILKRALIAVLGWTIKKLYRAVLLLRLFVLVLERDSARSDQAGDAARRQIDDGSAWLDFCDSLRGLLDFVLTPPQLPAPPPVATAGGAPEQGQGQGDGRRDATSHNGDGPGGGGSSGARAGAGAGGDGPLAMDSLDRVEGLRYLTRVMRGALEAFMDCWDPAWPVLRTLPYNVKLGADNPDNLYMYGTVSGAFEYRLYGKRGSVTYLSIGVYTGSRPGAGHGKAAHLDSSRLVTQPDGRFEIFLTREPRGPNWLPLHPDASRVVVRQTFLRRHLEAAAEVAIERLPLAPPSAAPAAAAPAAVMPAGCRQGASGAASEPMVDARGREVRPPLAPGQVVAGLAGAAVFIAGSVRQFQAWAAGFASRPNRLATLDHDVNAAAWADPAIHFFHGYWRLGPGEALLIQATPPDCPYWNFQLDNVWMESMDTLAHPETTVNKATASYMPDGSVCLVVSPTDPRVAASAAAGEAGEGGERESLAALLPPELLAGVTWVSTAHHAHGTMGLRWVLADRHPVPSCRVVALGRPLAEAISAGVAAKKG